MKQMFKTTLITFSAAILLYACSGSPRFTSADYPPANNSTLPEPTHEEDNSGPKEETPVRYQNYSVLQIDEGLASFYGTKFDGKPTASGEIFDMYELTAAHRTYPLGTIARVTNKENNKSIIVKINDRGPVPENRIIDLSYGAAKLLDMINDGLTEVKIEILEWGNK